MKLFKRNSPIRFAVWIARKQRFASPLHTLGNCHTPSQGLCTRWWYCYTFASWQNCRKICTYFVYGIWMWTMATHSTCSFMYVGNCSTSTVILISIGRRSSTQWSRRVRWRRRIVRSTDYLFSRFSTFEVFYSRYSPLLLPFIDVLSE